MVHKNKATKIGAYKKLSIKIKQLKQVHERIVHKNKIIQVDAYKNEPKTKATEVAA